MSLPPFKTLLALMALPWSLTFMALAAPSASRYSGIQAPSSPKPAFPSDLTFMALAASSATCCCDIATRSWGLGAWLWRRANSPLHNMSSSAHNTQLSPLSSANAIYHMHGDIGLHLHTAKP